MTDFQQQIRLLRQLGFGFLTELPPGAAVDSAPGPKASDSPPPSLSEDLPGIAAAIRGCTACPLHLARTNAVPGRGAPRPRLLIIGDMPTGEDDLAGEPFTGSIGVMLGKIVAAVGLTMGDVYLAQAVRCRPPERRPRPAEIAACRPYLAREAALLRPEAIVSFGLGGVEALLGEPPPGGLPRLRGRWIDADGIPLLATFALDYIEGHPDRKRRVWEDLQLVIEKLRERQPS